MNNPILALTFYHTQISMILKSCPDYAINRLFSKQNISVTDYGTELFASKKLKKVYITTRISFEKVTFSGMRTRGFALF